MAPPETVEKIETSLSSVEITKNSKGVCFKVKVYDESPFTAKGLATDIFTELQKKYKDEG